MVAKGAFGKGKGFMVWDPSQLPSNESKEHM
jgi:hypothetical protein